MQKPREDFDDAIFYKNSSRSRAGRGKLLGDVYRSSGPNGQGEAREEYLENLKEAVRLLLEVEREEGLRHDPQGEEVLQNVCMIHRSEIKRWCDRVGREFRPERIILF